MVHENMYFLNINVFSKIKCKCISQFFYQTKDPFKTDHKSVQARTHTVFIMKNRSSRFCQFLGALFFTLSERGALFPKGPVFTKICTKTTQIIRKLTNYQKPKIRE